MNKVKNQHFVPRFYLRNFANRRNQIYVFDKTTSISFKTAIENIAQHKYFYDIEELDNLTGHQTVEKILSKIEHQASISLNKLIDHISNNTIKLFSRSDRFVIAQYIYIQLFRTNESRIITDQISKEFSRQLSHLSFDDNFIEANQLNHETFDSKLFQAENILTANDSTRVSELLGRTWIFWVNCTKHHFYTSDHPCFAFTDKKGTYEVFLSLSPNIAISLVNSRIPEIQTLHNKVINIDDVKIMTNYNSLIVHHSNRHVFSNENDFRLVKKLIKQFPIVTDKNRQRITKRKF